MAGRVLIVDDEPDIVMLLKMALERRGFDVITASDGQMALACAREHRPDVMTLDVMMPELDGLSVCRALKEDPSGCRIKIILLTAKDRGADKTAGMDAGADAYITKPFDIKDVVEQIRILLTQDPV